MDRYANGPSQQKTEIKKVFICGGTGLLGFYTTLEFLKKRINVETLALPDIALGSWFPNEVSIKYFNVYEASNEELVNLFSGADAIIYAIGPNSSVHPPKGISAYDYFYENLIEKVKPIFIAAKTAKVKKAILLNSYLSFFDRTYPEKHLAEHHPYIKARVDQEESLIKIGDGGYNNGGIDVISLEIPLVFGGMPERTSPIKNILLEKLLKKPTIIFPKGGTNIAHVTEVANSIVAATLYAQHQDRLPIGTNDESYKHIIDNLMSEAGAMKKCITIPTQIATLSGYVTYYKQKRENIDSGLDYRKLMTDILSQNFYNATECALVRNYLHFNELGYCIKNDNLTKGFLETMVSCYPHRFNNNNLKNEFNGTNLLAKENAENNPVTLKIK